MLSMLKFYQLTEILMYMYYYEEDIVAISHGVPVANYGKKQAPFSNVMTEKWVMVHPRIGRRLWMQLNDKVLMWFV